MSHFSVLVITPTKPDKKELERIMQPWHEFECTGIKDQYVVEVDVTDRVHEEFNKSKDVVVLPLIGELAPGVKYVFSRYDDRFYTKESTDPMNKHVGRKEFELPLGAEIKTMTAEEARSHGVGYKTLSECAKEYFGSSIERDDKFYKLTNPNKKWDWWQIGGRWTGFLVPHYDPDKDPDNIEVCKFCHGTGKRTDSLAHEPGNEHLLEKCNACNGKGRHPKWPTERKRIEGDQMRLGDIPLLTLRDVEEERALKRYDKAHEIIKGREILVWEKVVEKHFNNYEQAREEFNNNEVIKELKEANILGFMMDGTEDFTLTRELVARNARNAAICPFAFVHNGEWHERGEMGWFATDEKDLGQWAEEFNKMVDNLHPDTWLTVIDCHI